MVQVRSIYAWEGRIEDQGEVLALFKTLQGAPAKRLKAEIARIHPYKVPEIVELKMSDVSKSYLSWLAAESAHGVAEKRHDPSKR